MKYFLCLILSFSLFTKELNGIIYPDTLSYNSNEYVLNGLGQRLATWFNVKVYVAALYVQEKSTESSKLLNSSSDKIIKLKFQRFVKSTDMIKALNTAMKTNKDGKDKLNKLVQDIEKDQEVVYYLTKDKIEVSYNGTSAGSVNVQGIDRDFLNVFIGDNPPNEELKAGLLGN